MRWLLSSILAVLVCPVLVKADTQQQTYNNFEPLPGNAKKLLDIGQATIDNPGVANQLIGVLLSDRFVPSVKDKQAYCIIHVLRWGEPDTTTKKQSIQAQNWYLYSTLRSTKAGWTQDDFTKNKRLLGSHRVYIIYIHLNLAPASAVYIPSYRLTVTKKVPANIQHLLTLFQAFAPAATGGSGSALTQHIAEIPTDYYGWGLLDLQYDPSDITVSSTTRAVKNGAADSSPEAKLSDDITFDNEGGYNFDFGFAVPIKKISQVNVNFTNGTATPVNDLSVFMAVDGYLKPVDVKSSKWTNWPHPLAGAAFAKRPLSRILVGGAWGPRFSELYLGAMFVKQPKRTAGNSCKGSNISGVVTGSYQYCAQFSIGINLPVSGIASALSKPR